MSVPACTKIYAPSPILLGSEMKNVKFGEGTVSASYGNATSEDGYYSSQGASLRVSYSPIENWVVNSTSYLAETEGLKDNPRAMGTRLGLRYQPLRYLAVEGGLGGAKVKTATTAMADLGLLAHTDFKYMNLMLGYRLLAYNSEGLESTNGPASLGYPYQNNYLGSSFHFGTMFTIKKRINIGLEYGLIETPRNNGIPEANGYPIPVVDPFRGISGDYVLISMGYTFHTKKKQQKHPHKKARLSISH